MMIIISDYIAAIRYIIIPIVGFLIGAFLFLLIYKKYSDKLYGEIEAYVEKHRNKLLYFGIVVYSLYFLSIINLRYCSNHLSIFDFGIYDFAIWLIKDISWSDWPEKIKSSIMGHFQPVLVGYSILYDLNAEPVILNILQAIAVISGIIPLYLIAKAKLKGQINILSICFLYLLYPATQFNIAVDFHPDHLIIPILFWCYYFVETGKLYWTIPLVMIGYTLKEPLILSFAFMGLYIVWGKRRYSFGSILFFISSMVFYAVIFIILPAVGNFRPYETATGSSAFSYIFESEGIIPILKEVFVFEKWRFPLFLLFPVLFLPILRIKEFMPAIPLLIIQILSTVELHQNVASHYTAGIVPPVFVALISAIAYLHDRFGNRLIIAIFVWLGIMTLSFNIAHSPSPLGVAFWHKDWSGGKWHYSMYIKSEHEMVLENAINLVPNVPNVKVVTHSEIYHRKLAHRYFYKPFPDTWQDADYIILDNARGPYLSGSYNEAGYQQRLQEVKDDKGFKVIFDKDDILVFTSIR